MSKKVKSYEVKDVRALRSDRVLYSVCLKCYGLFFQPDFDPDRIIPRDKCWYKGCGGKIHYPPPCVPGASDDMFVKEGLIKRRYTRRKVTVEETKNDGQTNAIEEPEVTS